MDEMVAEDCLDHNPPPFPGLKPFRRSFTSADIFIANRLIYR